MTIWYLHPADNEPRTNAYLVQVIGESNMENTWTGICADGKPHDLYECPNGWVDVKKAIVAIREFSLKLEVFKLEGDNRPVRFDLWKQSARKKGKVVQRMASMLRPRQKAI